MTQLDDDLVPAVGDLINNVVGASATWTKTTTAGTVDPVTSAITGDSTTDYPIKVTPPSPFEKKFIDGDTVKEGDLTFLLAGENLAFTPENGDIVDFDGGTWGVVKVEPIRSGDSVAAWQIQMRQ